MCAVCSKSKDSIDYDEYLDGGIPDTLLEGLGFYTSTDDMEMTCEADEMPTEQPGCENIIEPHSATSASTATGMSLSFVPLLT